MAFPTIDTELTLVETAEGGRRYPLDLRDSTALYRPHIVIGDPNQRAPTISGGVIAEQYLGVQFFSQGTVLQPGDTARVTMLLMYYPEAPSAYAGAQPGATFTLREGGAVVGYGTIVNRSDG